MATGQIAIKPCAPFNFDLSAHFRNDDKKITSAQARQIAKSSEKWEELSAYYMVFAGMSDVEV